MLRLRYVKLVWVVVCCTAVCVVHKLSVHIAGKDINHITRIQNRNLIGVTRRTKQRTMLIILTYMRSGSSFTGAVVQRHPDVFYVFEPLHEVERLNNLAGGKNDHLQRQLSTLESILLCNTSLTEASTLGQYHMKSSPDTAPFHYCFHHQEYKQRVASCAMLLENTCKKSSVAAAKVIRIGMKNVTYLMNKYNKMKVLHLIRDPRAVLLSQLNVGQFKVSDLGASSNRLCRRVKQDVDDSREMNRRFPGRVKTIRYEDLAERPLTMAKQLFDFIDLDLTDEIKGYIYNITHATHDDCGSLCIRKNSKERISKWRLSLTFAQVSLIEKKCQRLFDVMGYLPAVSDVNLRNLSRQLYNHMSGPSHIY
ncbi:carbohydrate sulfotransferase 5-like [Haliotis asinina]|uniref:carbohydrate sulfotransferase 5-like n=1 Tax=Haliotis asinina TaxID=109174 RepID=UPI003531B8C8